MRAVVAVALTALVLVPLALANVAAKSVSAGSGSVRATLSYERAHGGYGYDHVSLQIRRRSRLVFDRRMPPYSKRITTVWPGFAGPNRKPVAVRRLDASAEPEVLVDLFWGGAHCCTWTRVYRYRPATGTYVASQHLWGDPGYVLRTIGGRPVFVTGDDAFAYAFTDYADSPLPVQLWAWHTGRFENVTRHYPAQIRADARRLATGIRQARARHGELRGLLAAWTADQFLLGRRVAATSQLNGLASSGALAPAPGGVDTPADPHEYVRALLTFLRKHGYG